MGEIIEIAQAFYDGVVNGNLWVVAGAAVLFLVQGTRKLAARRGLLQSDRWGVILPILFSFFGSVSNAAIAGAGMPGWDAMLGSVKVLAIAIVMYIVPKKLLFPSDKKQKRCSKCGRLLPPSLR